MKERPILFKGEMVRAILDGRKTQTRRVVKKPVDEWRIVAFNFQGASGRNYVLLQDADRTYRGFPCPYGKPGDQLWVREKHAICGPNVWYAAECDNAPAWEVCEYPDGSNYDGKWRPSIHMPRWASRITLEVTGVRVEGVQDITDRDALFEGIDYYAPPKNSEAYGAWDMMSPSEGFMHLWDSINGKKYPWESNPFVWVVEFKRMAQESTGVTL